MLRGWPVISLLVLLITAAGSGLSVFARGQEEQPTTRSADGIAEGFENAFVRLPVPSKILRSYARQIEKHMGASGALGSNNSVRSGAHDNWFVEPQRRGYELVAAGVAADDERFVELGLRALEWAFARQDPDGSFASAFHSTSIFLAAAARSVLLLQQAKVSDGIRRRAQALIPRMHKAASWLAEPARLQSGVNRVFTHRFFLVATALQEVAVLTGDEHLAAAATPLVLEGLSRQRSDGVFPERDGPDTTYHSLSIELITRYAVLIKDSELRRTLRGSAKRAVDWLVERVGPDGTILHDQNTRTGRCDQRNRGGKPKNVGYKRMPLQLSYYGSFWGDMDTVHRVVDSVAARGPRFALDCP